MPSKQIYEGEERRRHVQVLQCDFHSKVIADLTEEVKDVRADLKDRRQWLDDRMDAHENAMWEAIRDKLTTKVALAFIFAFTLAYIVGVIAVYKGTQENRLYISEQIHSLSLTINDVQHDIRGIKDTINNLHKKE